MDRWWLPGKADDALSERPIFLEDLLVLSDTLYGVGVPYTSRETFMRQIFGAMKADLMGTKPDKVVSTFGDSWSFEEIDGPLKTLYVSSAEVRPMVVKALRELHERPEFRIRIGCIASHAALFRLQSTFQACVLVVRQGMHYETQALLRLIVEQLAWAKAILDFDDDTFFAIQPTHCISGLKPLFPEAGRMYGDLSSGAHLSPKTTVRYLSESDGLFQIAHSLGDWCLVDCLRLLKVADYFSVMCEFVVKEPGRLGSSLSYDERSDVWSLRADRPSLEPFTRYKPIIDTALAEFQRQNPTS
jgi:hypothetical protein